MRRKHVALGVAVAAAGFLAAACGASGGGGTSSGDARPVKAAMSAAVEPAAAVAGPLRATAQAGPDVSLVLGRPDTVQQGQPLQQADNTAALTGQATAAASGSGELFCG